MGVNLGNKNKSFELALNEYLTNEVLQTELIESNYILSVCDWKKDWAAMGSKSGTFSEATGNDIVIPIKVGRANSVRYGKYTASADVTQSRILRGKEGSVADIHATVKFNHRDLMVHGKFSKQNFLTIMPDEVEDAMESMKSEVNRDMLHGAVIDTITGVADAAAGAVKVARPDRFEVGALYEMFRGANVRYGDNGGVGGAAGAGAAKNFLMCVGIDVDKKDVYFQVVASASSVLSTAWSATDLSGNGNDAAAKVAVGDTFQRHDARLAGNDQGFKSIRKILLSAAAGGDATYLGYTKALYPFLQAYNYNGAGVDNTNFLKKLFAMRVEMATFSKAKPKEIVMSLQNLGVCMAIAEIQKTAYNIVPGSQKADVYGLEITIGGPGNSPIKLRGLQEFPDDIVIAAEDWKEVCFYSDGGVKKVISPDGNSYTPERTEDGHFYLQDIDLIGQVVIKKPYKFAIMYGIPTLSIV